MMFNKFLRWNVLGNVIQHAIPNKSATDEPMDLSESVHTREELDDCGSFSTKTTVQFFVIRGPLLNWYEN